MHDLIIGLVSSVLVTIVAVAFAWLGGHVIDWVRKHNRGS